MRMFENPLFIFLIISTAMALPFSSSALEFVKYFVVCSVFQIIGVRVYFNIVQFFSEKIKNERIKEYSKQGVEIVCPCYMEKKFLLPLNLNGENSFSCTECKRDFSVDVSARAFLQTDPIDIEKADAAFVEVVNKIRSSK